MAPSVLDQIVRQTNAKTLEAVEHAIKGHAQKALAALDHGGGKVIEQADLGERMKLIAKNFADMSHKDRDATLVLDPSKEGRDLLTAAIRAELTRRGQLGADSLTMAALTPKDLTKAERAQAGSYEPGDVVIFAKAKPDKRILAKTAYTVTASNPDKGMVTLTSASGFELKLEPVYWGQAEAFTRSQIELREGDRVAFARNDHEKARVNGLTGTVAHVDPKRGSVMVYTDTGQKHELDTSSARDQHLRHAWVDTIHAAQGKTAERAIIHAESGRSNLIDQKSMYVAMSRPRSETIIVTNSREKLLRGLADRSGEQGTALRMGQKQQVAQDRGTGIGM